MSFISDGSQGVRVSEISHYRVCRDIRTDKEGKPEIWTEVTLKNNWSVMLVGDFSAEILAFGRLEKT